MTTDQHPSGEYPYRVVDADNRGWITNGDGTYHGFDPSADLDRERTLILETRPLAAIEAEAGPVRPVVSRSAEDVAQLEAAFAAAGRKLIGSLASALEQIYHEARERFGPWDSDPTSSAGYAQRTLTAGRPGSWEASAVMDVVWFGNELNLWPREGAESVAHMRATGPNTKRVDVAARDKIAAVLRRWVTDPAGYVELAETLAALVSDYADKHHDADGWKAIADQWLQPTSLDRENFVGCYRLLYSVSAHFNADHL